MTATPAINPDRMLYFVLCRFRSGLAWVERDVGRTNRRDTLADIRSGELRDVVQVIELNTAEFSSRDVTEDFVTEDETPLSPSERLVAMADHARDYRKHWEPAT